MLGLILVSNLLCMVWLCKLIFNYMLLAIEFELDCSHTMYYFLLIDCQSSKKTKSITQNIITVSR